MWTYLARQVDVRQVFTVDRVWTVKAGVVSESPPSVTRMACRRVIIATKKAPDAIGPYNQVRHIFHS